MDNSRCKIYL